MWQVLKYWFASSIIIGFHQTMRSGNGTIYPCDLSNSGVQQKLATEIITGMTLPFHVAKRMVPILKKKFEE